MPTDLANNNPTSIINFSLVFILVLLSAWKGHTAEDTSMQCHVSFTLNRKLQYAARPLSIGAAFKISDIPSPVNSNFSSIPKTKLHQECQLALVQSSSLRDIQTFQLQMAYTPSFLSSTSSSWLKQQGVILPGYFVSMHQMQVFKRGPILRYIQGDEG